jgi:hypothetical protein
VTYPQPESRVNLSKVNKLEAGLDYWYGIHKGIQAPHPADTKSRLSNLGVFRFEHSSNS